MKRTLAALVIQKKNTQIGSLFVVFLRAQHGEMLDN
jgi:hypothetical protein